MDQTIAENKPKFDIKVNELTEKAKEMRVKFNDYFEYALQAKKIAEDEDLSLPECSTSQECGDSGKLQKCCVNAVFHHKASNTKDVMYRCMPTAVVDANIDFQLGDFEVQMNCEGQVNSGAAMLATGASLALVAASLF